MMAAVEAAPPAEELPVVPANQSTGEDLTVVTWGSTSARQVFEDAGFVG